MCDVVNTDHVDSRLVLDPAVPTPHDANLRFGGLVCQFLLRHLVHATR